MGRKPHPSTRPQTPLAERLEHARTLVGYGEAPLKEFWKALAFDPEIHRGYGSEAAARIYHYGKDAEGRVRDAPAAYLARVCERFPRIDPEWLLTGSGEPTRRHTTGPRQPSAYERVFRREFDLEHENSADKHVLRALEDLALQVRFIREDLEFARELEEEWLSEAERDELDGLTARRVVEAVRCPIRLLLPRGFPLSAAQLIDYIDLLRLGITQLDPPEAGRGGKSGTSPRMLLEDMRREQANSEEEHVCCWRTCVVSRRTPRRRANHEPQAEAVHR